MLGNKGEPDGAASVTEILGRIEGVGERGARDVHLGFVRQRHLLLQRARALPANAGLLRRLRNVCLRDVSRRVIQSLGRGGETKAFLLGGFLFLGVSGRARAASASSWSPPAPRSAREAMSTTVGTVVMAVRLCPLFVRGATPAKGVPSGPLEANEDSAKHERAPIVCAYSP